MLICPKCKKEMKFGGAIPTDGINGRATENLWVCPTCYMVEGSNNKNTVEIDSNKVNKLIKRSSKQWWQVWK